MIKYYHQRVEKDWGVVDLYASCQHNTTSVDFNIVVEYNGAEFVYKTWSRQKFGVSHQDEMPDDEPIVRRLASKIDDWDRGLFEAWFANHKNILT